MRVLFCPTHYVYDDSREGSELSWAYNIADRIGSVYQTSVVVTGRSTVGLRPYRIVEVDPDEDRVNFGLAHAFMFNTRYTIAALRALHRGHYDVVHHVLPFAIGRTYNVAALRHGSTTPFVIGPVQPPVAVRDPDVDPTDFKSHRSQGRTGLASLRRSATYTFGAFVSDVLAPVTFSRLSARTVSRATAVVAVNNEARALLIASGASPSRVVVIPPGIDTNRFQPLPPSVSRPGRLELLAASQLVKRKNVDLIIRAFAQLAETAPHAKLRIVGDGPEREALMRMTHILGLGGKVTFTGFVPHAAVHEEYQRADIFVNASSWEGFATSCLEALSSGLPVVSTRVGGFADAVEDARTGYLIEGRDSLEFATVMQRFLQNPTLIGEQAARARELAEREFDWARAVIPRYMQVYDQAIRERAQSRLTNRVA